MVASTGMVSDDLAGTAPSTTTRTPAIDNSNSSTSNKTSSSTSALGSNPTSNHPSSSSNKDPGHTSSSSYANNVDASAHTRGEKHASLSADSSVDASADGTSSNGTSGVKKIVSKIGEKLSAGSSGSGDPSLSAGSATQGATGHNLANSARHPDQGLGHGHAGSNLNRE